VPIVGAAGWNVKFATGSAWPACTTIVPCIIEPCTTQKYGNDPAVGKACEKFPEVFTPESQVPFALQPAEQEPEVVLWPPAFQVHMTLSPALIVVVLFPLAESVNRSFVMLTLAVAPGAAAESSATARTASKRTWIRNDREMTVSMGISFFVTTTLRAY
jgi:hypothetical protein